MVFNGSLRSPKFFNESKRGEFRTTNETNCTNFKYNPLLKKSMGFTCQFCGKEQKRTWQHLFAGDFRGTPKKKICIECHQININKTVQLSFKNLDTPENIPTTTYIGETKVNITLGSFTVGTVPSPLPGVPSDLQTIVEVHGRARDFNANEPKYRMSLIQSSGTTIHVSSGSVGGIVDYVALHGAGSAIWIN